MPAALARDADRTVFTYRAIISPPADWSEWRLLVTELAAHLVDRYGIDEVAQWAFEVWNEPNLEVFWTGSRQEYLRLYEEAALAVKSVDQRLRVGGPATAAGEWIEPLAAHAARTGAAVDFVSSHTYGNIPLDPRPALRRHGLDGIPIWWTEWGIGATHFGPAHDSAMGAPFVLSGLHSAQGRIDALAYWVISDHFEELGRPARLFHNGFGLLTVGNLRKPRYWAVHLAEHLGDRLLAVRAAGDGAGTLVQAWAARHDDGTIDVLVWNGSVNVALAGGDPRLDRQVAVTVGGLSEPSLRGEPGPGGRTALEHRGALPGRGDLARPGAVGATQGRGRTARGTGRRRHARGRDGPLRRRPAHARRGEDPPVASPPMRRTEDEPPNATPARNSRPTMLVALLAVLAMALAGLLPARHALAGSALGLPVSGWLPTPGSPRHSAPTCSASPAPPGSSTVPTSTRPPTCRWTMSATRAARARPPARAGTPRREHRRVPVGGRGRERPAPDQHAGQAVQRVGPP